MLKAYALTHHGVLKRTTEVYTIAYVAAATPWEARLVHPDTELKWSFADDCWVDPDGFKVDDGAWPRPEDVTVHPAGAAPADAHHGKVLGCRFVPG